MIRPSTQIDAFSAAAYADEAGIAAKFKEMRTQGDVLWVEQEPWRPFWAVLRHKDIMEVERHSKVWLIAENPDFAPIEVNLKDQELVIEGLSVGVIRR